MSRMYSEAEKCVLLLFARLDGETPLTPKAFWDMEQALHALGPARITPAAEVTREALLRLGVREETAALVLRRLGMERELREHLSAMRARGIRVVTRISPEYPEKLRRTLGKNAPMLLYCAGNLTLFEKSCVSLVGSRRLRRPGAEFARTLGMAAAREGYAYVSGGAVGADTEGYLGAENAGGSAILFLPDSLRKRMDRMRDALGKGRLLLVSEEGFDEPFSARRAYARNRLIHAMGEKTFVAQSDYGAGGTWNGVMENLKNGWSPVYVCASEPEDPGARGLAAQGCHPVRPEDLQNLAGLEPAQTGLFD